MPSQSISLDLVFFTKRGSSIIFILLSNNFESNLSFKKLVPLATSDALEAVNKFLNRLEAIFESNITLVLHVFIFLEFNFATAFSAVVSPTFFRSPKSLKYTSDLKSYSLSILDSFPASIASI